MGQVSDPRLMQYSTHSMHQLALISFLPGLGSRPHLGFNPAFQRKKSLPTPFFASLGLFGLSPHVLLGQDSTGGGFQQKPQAVENSLRALGVSGANPEDVH